MKTLLILASTVIGILVGYAMSDGFGGSPGIGTMLNGVLTLILMAAGGGVGLAVGVVIAIVPWAGESKPSARRDASDPE